MKRMMCSNMRSAVVFAIAAISLFLLCGFAPGFAYADSVDDVAAMIEALPADPREYTAGDRGKVESIQAAFESLSAEDQAKLDERKTHPSDTQSLGRVLESGLWSVRSFGVDNSTTLANGTYTTSTSPAISSVSDKGKSDSVRTRCWWVESVEVVDGQAQANIYVTEGAATLSKLATYPGVWIGGVEYPRNADNTFTIPIDLNGGTYFAGISSSMPRPIMYRLDTTIEEPAYTLVHTVTFTNGLPEGQREILKTEEVAHGQSATAPVDVPERDGFVFARWDASFDNVTADLTVNAVWHKEGVNYYWVTFENGQGTVIDSIEVEAGSSVTPPSDPKRSGFAFEGWNTSADGSGDFYASGASFKPEGNVTLYAQWLSEDQVTVDAVREKIAAIAADETSLIGKTDDAVVAEAGKAYNAMSEDLRALIPESERMHLVRALIAVLPSDPFDMTSDMSTQVKTAQSAYETLSKEQKDALDAEKITGSRSYGRYLESASWAHDSLRSVNDVTFLKDGTYSTGITSSSSRGKNALKHDVTFTVKSVKVTGGHVMATVECSATSYQTLFLGNKKYENIQPQAGAKPLFEIPLNLNSTFHFSVKSKSATEETEAVAFEMTVSADEGSMTPDPEQQGGQATPSGGSSIPGPSNPQGTSGGGGSSGGNAGNLSSLLGTNNNTNNGASSNQSGAAAATENRPGSSATASTSGKSSNASSGSALSAKSASTNEAADVASVDLAPAVSGGTMLGLSIGCLGFAMRFVRRESLLA